MEERTKRIDPVACEMIYGQGGCGSNLQGNSGGSPNNFLESLVSWVHFVFSTPLLMNCACHPGTKPSKSGFAGKWLSDSLLLQSTCSIQPLLEPCETKQFSTRFMPGHHVGQADFLDRRRELFVWGVYVRWTAGRRYYDVSSFWAVFSKLTWAFRIAGINRSDIRIVEQDEWRRASWFLHLQVLLCFHVGSQHASGLGRQVPRIGDKQII